MKLQAVTSSTPWKNNSAGGGARIPSCGCASKASWNARSMPAVH